MKAVILMYLEDDSAQVERLLAAHEVAAYSELPVEGHGLGTAGWYGKVAPYRSRMLLSFLSAAKAEELLAAVSTCSGCSDASHPIHAWQVDVEKSVASGLSSAPGRV
ncbi:MAG: hypothetical protein Q8N53_05630 [Longimicrobiales bacterium]|nr:hypothetical protein [Longimicrobiales bacterium]